MTHGRADNIDTYIILTRLFNIFLKTIIIGAHMFHFKESKAIR